MNKAVLISIQPKWCELIASGEKTIEVRKTRPRIDVPFKCYIYCTKDEPMYRSGEKFWCSNDDCGNGKVIGEFVCDKIITAEAGCYCNIPKAESQVDAFDLMDYADEKPVFGWHISDLVIYDKPKSLRDFYLAAYRQGNRVRPPKPLTRAPQSWCYVEELKGDTTCKT